MNNVGDNYFSDAKILAHSCLPKMKELYVYWTWAKTRTNSLSNASPLRCRLPPYSTSVHHLSCRHSRKQILLRSLSENSPAAKMVRYWHKMMSAKSYFPHFSSSAYIICVWDSQFKNGLTHIYSPPTFKEQSKQNRKKFVTWVYQEHLWELLLQLSMVRN